MKEAREKKEEATPQVSSVSNDIDFQRRCSLKVLGKI